jgi:predicted RNA binding protein YcfA (HicA-like mRNA interferase family)
MPSYVRGVSFADALARFNLVGWEQVNQEGSHVALRHPNLPDVIIRLPDHRRRDLKPRTLGAAVEAAGLTAEQFLRLAGNGSRRYARQIRREVYGMED